MKKFLLITALLVPAVASAADADVLEQPAPRTTPEYVTIAQTNTPGLYSMTWTDPVRSPLGVSMQFTQEQVENDIVQIGYTRNGVFQENKWYRADFSDVVVLFKEGTQKLYTVTPEQRAMIIEAELSVDEKAEVLQTAQDTRVEKVQEIVKKAKEVLEQQAAQEAEVAAQAEAEQDTATDEDTQEQPVDAPAYAERSGSEDAEVVAQDEAAVEDAVEQENADAGKDDQEQVEDTDADDSDEQEADQADVPAQDSVDTRDVFIPGFTD